MDKIREIIKKFRHPIAMLSIFLGAAACFGWIGYRDVAAASTQTEREIVNDDYTALSAPIDGTGEVYQNITVKGGTRLYGISVNIHTFNRIQQGTLNVQLLKDGEVLASAAEDMQFLLDNTFKRILFDNMQFSHRDENYTLRFWVEPAQPGVDKLSLWKSRENYPGFEMTDGTEEAGTVALQYITAYAGGSIYKYFALFSRLAVIALEGSYLLIFVKKAAAHYVVLFAGIVMGTMFCIFTPIGGGPDEYFHIATSYKISNRLMGVENLPGYESLLVRRCDDDDAIKGPVEYDVFGFQKIIEGLDDTDRGRDSLVKIQVNTGYGFQALHFPQTLMITLARLTHRGFVPMVIMGRLFSLAIYLFCAVLAVKLTPIFKTTFAICALLPMALQTVCSFSYDSYVLALSILFIGAVFNLAYNKKKASLPMVIFAAAVFGLLAPSKVIYILLGRIVFIIPSSQFNSKKNARLAKRGILLAGVLIWLSANLNTVRWSLGLNSFNMPDFRDIITVQRSAREAPEQGQPDTQEEPSADSRQAPAEGEKFAYPFENAKSEEPLPAYDPNSDLLPNGDSKYTFTLSYILHNPKAAVKLLLNTITTQSGRFVQTMLGTRLGEIIVVDLQASYIFLFALIAVLYLSALPAEGEKNPHGAAAKLWCALVFWALVGVILVVCYTWTPINYQSMFGLQGRYALPALPLLITALGGKNLTLKKPVDGGLMFALVATNMLIMLNVFSLMVGV